MKLNSYKTQETLIKMTRQNQINSSLLTTHSQLGMTECGSGGGNSPYSMENNYQLFRNKLEKTVVLFKRQTCYEGI